MGVSRYKGDLMRAAVCTRYGPPSVLEVRDISMPSPKNKEILVKIYARTVSSGDCRVRGLSVPQGMGLLVRLAFGFKKPRNPVLGTDLAGEVVGIGKEVTRFKVGDRVFAMNGMSMGGYADYKCLTEDAAVTHIPETLSFEDAAAIPFGGTTAWDFVVRKAGLRSGERLLINGASGAVGFAALQIGKLQNAHVTGVCSGQNIELIKSLGADGAIDYRQEDFRQSEKTYDVILDTVGNLDFASCKHSLNKGGRLILLTAGLYEMLRAPLQSAWSEKRVIVGTAAEKAEDLAVLASLAAQGKYLGVIDRRYSLEEIVQAHSYVETGRKRGNVIVSR